MSRRRGTLPLRGAAPSPARLPLAGFALACACAAAALPGIAHAEVKDAGQDGFTIENAGWAPVDRAAAWKTLVDEVGLWWPADHTWGGDAGRLSIDARAGGCFCEIDGQRQAEHLRVVFAEPGTLLRMSGGLGPLQGLGVHGVLEFRLTAAQRDGRDGTRVVLYYRAGGYGPEDLAAFAPIVDRVQAQQLGGLLRRLGGAADPVPAPATAPAGDARPAP